MDIFERESEILRARRTIVVSTLKSLGYSSIESINETLDDTNLYFGLNKLGEELDNFKLPNPDEEIIFLQTDEERLPVLKSLQERILREKETKAEIDDIFERARGVSEDYCLGMHKKIPYENWKKYSETVQKAARLYLALNADVIPKSVLRKAGVDEDLLDLNELEIEDRISQLIDSKDFILACSIEDEFCVRESSKNRQKIDICKSEYGSSCSCFIKKIGGRD